MATISITIPNDTLAGYLAHIGATPLDDAIAGLMGMAMAPETDDDGSEPPPGLSVVAMRNGDLLTELLGAARKLATGEEFTITKLIPRARWEAMSATARRLIGKAFLVEAERCGVAKKDRINSANKAIYQRL